MEESILKTIKTMLGLDVADDSFDTDLIVHINTALMVATQLGIGPTAGFFIDGDTKTWANFVEDMPKYEALKTFVYMKVKLVFDPPPTSFVLEAMKNTILELEWRLRLQAETLVV